MNNWSQKRVVCSANEELVSFLKKKRQEIAETEGVSERLDSTLYKAYSNVCNTKTRIKTLKDFSQIKGVGKWILKISQDFFETDSGNSSEPEECLQKGKKMKGEKRYLPQKNSVAYALLITLYRGTLNGIEFMRKQQLIDAAEASGLSRVPINVCRSLLVPEKGRGIPTQIGSSGREWYSGWSCMKTLLTKQLVVKSSSPAKYTLTQEGVEAARECLSRCGLADCKDSGTSKKDASKYFLNQSVLKSDEEVTVLSDDSSAQEKSIVLPVKDVEKLNVKGANMSAAMMPPLKFGERFKDIYNVILILDDREQFSKTNKWARSKNIIENMSSELKIQVEVRRLPIGDAIWIAQDKHLKNEFVLDWIVERKEVDDFCMSIRDNRYKDQKLRLLKCGFKKRIYLVEGDPNLSEAAEAIKTACFTTEIHEGFDVQRTTGLLDTLSMVCDDMIKRNGTCPTFDEFIKKCEDLEKVTVSDVFCTQLVQVPQVTEEIALTVIDLYPTALSLARAYSVLEGNVQDQEAMLKRQSNNLISGPASRSIFRLIWGD
ncbi:hypothetical protein MKW94_025816 [Papaver nudicaule]|uniref:Crossover junction endonuclease MUS81 n=1 Tax=Papaver nudicaule TaxID=74823 RepID=A0AA41VLI2_PAPNU|nr:hypothetical protein [Papaver nudicaule]